MVTRWSRDEKMLKHIKIVKACSSECHNMWIFIHCHFQLLIFFMHAFTGNISFKVCLSVLYVHLGFVSILNPWWDASRLPITLFFVPKQNGRKVKIICVSIWSLHRVKFKSLFWDLHCNIWDILTSQLSFIFFISNSASFALTCWNQSDSIWLWGSYQVNHYHHLLKCWYNLENQIGVWLAFNSDWNSLFLLLEEIAYIIWFIWSLFLG